VINAIREAELILTDQEHIERCLNGEADQFGFLVIRYQRAVIAYLRGRMRYRDRAQEAAQETFVRAYFNLAKLKKRESFLSWLVGIARHVACEADRREQRERGVSAAYAELSPGVAKGGPALEEDLALEAALSSLPPKLRDVVLLRFYSGCSCLEVSQLLELPVGTVTKRLSRAYDLIRKRIQK